MRINLVLELKDIPGQLLNVLYPISKLGVNIVTVIHQRDFKNERGLIPVKIVLEANQDDLNRVIDKLNELKITILEIDDIIRKEKIPMVLIGHVIDTDIRDSVDRINQLDGVNLVNLEIKLSENNESSAILLIESDFGKRDLVINRVSQIAKEKELLVIDEV
ncbi:MAG: amino acid-binding protein [Methanobrevibacter sp.]|jgi:ACT domain-containing protein|nr:amino acid-binding protein [Candidatus Methanoflexus mossambicus]